jgi:hypothetical protein
MADVKISALPGATTPLDGTEILPIVQGGITEQVSVANLTAGRTVAAATVNVDANSASAAVRITQTGAGNALLIEDSASTDATPFIVDASGNVIVGYTTTVSVAGGTRPLTVNGAGQILVRATNDTSGPTLNMGKTRSTSLASNTIVQSGDQLGGIFFAGDDGTNISSSGASIAAAVDGTPGAGDMPGRLVFATTADGASSPTERMRITSGGLIGIGTAPFGNASFNLRTTYPDATQTTNYGFRNSFTSNAGATSQVSGYATAGMSGAASGSPYTTASLYHYTADAYTLGTNQTVTNQYGFWAGGGLTNATNNYGFYGNIGSGTGRWNFYAAGTANNAYAGNSRFGGLTVPVATVDVTGSVAATTTILSTGATSGIGYATGAGGAVTQGTSRTTGVTLNTVSGAITLFSAAGSAAYQSFTVTNSAVAATDTIIVNQKSGTDKYIILVTAVAAGSFQITFATTGGTTTEQPVFNFAVIKAVAA